MNVPHFNHRYSQARRGFTLLELLVVISILIVAFLVFSTFLGPGATGPALERNSRAIRAMVANIRQNSSTRKVHSELVIDYKHDQIVALARRRLVSFAFDGDSPTVGSGNVIGAPSGNAAIQASRTLLLMDGAALELPDMQSSFTIPWMDHYDVSGDYEGVAVSFDYFPLGANGSAIAAMGNVFTITVAEARENAVKLAVSSGGVTALADSWVALYRWCSVEIAVSRYGVSLYVDGRVNEARLPASGFSVPSAMGTDLRLGGVPCRIDNFEMNSLVSSQTLALADVQLIAPGVPAQLESTGEAEEIYDWKAEPPKANGPVTGNTTTPAPAPNSALPTNVPAIVHVYFDTAGKLDPARHAGAAYIYLIAVDNGEILRMQVTIHSLGAVTWDYVDLFPWEVPPNAPPQPGLPGDTP
ncbi:MAG: type II secretion system protein [Planctomycetes bacterium]|nr:type II secretion system protein [Planctomycetota bacterium]